MFSKDSDTAIRAAVAGLVRRNGKGKFELAGPATQRASETSRDRKLSLLAFAWLAALPPGLRPVELSIQYPRVANRLALCWPDAALTAKLFDDLLIDRRGGRRGFPGKVKAELLALKKSTDDLRLKDQSPPIRSDKRQDDAWRTWPQPRRT